MAINNNVSKCGYVTKEISKYNFYKLQKEIRNGKARNDLYFTIDFIIFIFCKNDEIIKFI